MKYLAMGATVASSLCSGAVFAAAAESGASGALSRGDVALMMVLSVALAARQLRRRHLHIRSLRFAGGIGELDH